MRGRQHRAARTLLTGLALTALAACSPAGPIDDEGVVTVELVDFAFDGVPDAVPAGTRLAVDNRSQGELHELVAFRLDDDDPPVDEIVALPPDQLAQRLGEPAVVLLAGPGGGEQVAAIGDGTLQQPGRYALICFIPTGVDPGEYLQAAAGVDGPPDVGDGPPHFLNGMVAELQVT